MPKTDQPEQPPTTSTAKYRYEDTQAEPVDINSKGVCTSLFNSAKSTISSITSRPVGNSKVNAKSRRMSPSDQGGVSIKDETLTGGDLLPDSDQSPQEETQESSGAMRDSLEVTQEFPEESTDTLQKARYTNRGRSSGNYRPYRDSGRYRQGISLGEELRKVKEKEQDHRETIRELRGKLHLVESQNDDQKVQIANLTQNAQQHGRHGLPYPLEDGHFKRGLQQLWWDVGQFARSASRDQQEPIGPNLPEILGQETYDTVKSAFANLPGLLSRKPTRTLRGRCMEIIIIKELEILIFGERVIGVSSSAEASIDTLWNKMVKGKSISERDLHLWEALTLHLLTKDNSRYNTKLKDGLEEVFATLESKLTPLGAPGKLGSFNELKNIISRAAKITREIATLPFIISQSHLVPGMNFDARLMEDEGLDDMSPEELQINQIPVDVILSQPVIKCGWDAEGKKLEDISKTNVVILCKGRVLCSPKR